MVLLSSIVPCLLFRPENCASLATSDKWFQTKLQRVLCVKIHGPTSLHCLPVLSYSDHEPFLRSRVPSSTANGMEMYSAVYRNGTDVKELMKLSTRRTSYLPSCFNYYFKPLSLRLSKSEDKTVIVVNRVVQRAHHLYFPVVPQNLLPNYTGTYFCCDLNFTKQCSATGRPTYKLQVVGESSD